MILLRSILAYRNKTFNGNTIYPLGDSGGECSHSLGAGSGEVLPSQTGCWGLFLDALDRLDVLFVN